MNDEESGQSAELNSYHGDIDPSFSAGRSGFVITHQTPLAHQPAESTLHDPAMGQDFEACEVIRTFDDLDGQFGAETLDPLGEGFASVAAIHPQDPQPSEPTQHPVQDHLCSVAFGDIGRTDGDAEHQPQSIHQQMPFSAFDPFTSVIANLTAVTGGFDTLTIQNGCRGSASFAVSFPDQCAQSVVERGPLVVTDPLPKNMVNRFPMGKILGQITPRTATLDEIQDGIKDAPPINRWAAASGGNREHWFEVSPLGIGETGVIYGVFHAPTEAALKMSRQKPSRMSTHPSTFLSAPIKKTSASLRNSANLIIQTHS